MKHFILELVTATALISLSAPAFAATAASLNVAQLSAPSSAVTISQAGARNLVTGSLLGSGNNLQISQSGTSNITRFFGDQGVDVSTASADKTTGTSTIVGNSNYVMYSLYGTANSGNVVNTKIVGDYGRLDTELTYAKNNTLNLAAAGGNYNIMESRFFIASNSSIDAHAYGTSNKVGIYLGGLTQAAATVYVDGNNNTVDSQQVSSNLGNVKLQVTGNRNGSIGTKFTIMQDNSANSTVNATLTGDRNALSILQRNTDNSSVTANITGNGNTVSAEQSSLTHTNNDIMNINVAGDNNMLSGLQQGNFNTLNIAGTGDSNTLSASQSGQGNLLSASFTANGSKSNNNTILANQLGASNSLLLNSGSNNQITALQNGTGNSMDVSFAGSRNNVQLSQVGTNLKYSMATTTSGQNINISQHN
jgi:hypothetical protein